MSKGDTPALHGLVLTGLVLVAAGCGQAQDLRARAEGQLDRGMTALTAGTWDRAWPLCDAARSNGADPAASLRCAALAAMGWGRWDLAVAALRDLQGAGAGEPWIPVALWLALDRSGDPQAAARLAEELDGQGDSGEVLDAIRGLALSEGRDGVYRGAPPGLGDGQAAGPGGRTVPGAAAQALLAAVLDGSLEPAAAVRHASSPELRLVLSAAAGTPPGALPEGAWRREPRLDRLARLVPGAAEACEPGSAAAAAPQEPDAALRLLEGVCLETRGETLAALERYDEAVALAPELRTARLDRALLLARLGRMAEARTELDLLAGVAPGNPVVRLVAGMLAAAEGDRDAVARCREELGVLAPAYAAWLDEGVRE